MKRSNILVLCFLAILLGESIATTGESVHNESPSLKSELLQTQSRSMTETETSSQTAAETATGTETDTGCDPDCLFNYPYREGGCKPPPEEELIITEGEGPYDPIPPTVIVTTEEEGFITEDTYETEGSSSEEILPPTPRIEEEQDLEIYEGTYETEGSFSEEIPLTPPKIEEEEGLDIYEGTYETEGSFSEEISLTPVIEQQEESWLNKEECVYTVSLSSGVTHAYGQPTTYLTYIIHDDKKDEDVTYTYVLTTMYQGTVQNSENDYVVYGTGAINFYNTYYGVNDYLTDKPGCSCVCGYSSYTFSYSFDF